MTFFWQITYQLLTNLTHITFLYNIYPTFPCKLQNGQDIGYFDSSKYVIPRQKLVLVPGDTFREIR